MKNIIQSHWNEILETVKAEHEISSVSFRTWLLPLSVYAVTDEVITILVDEKLVGSDSTGFIKKRYGLPIKVAIAEITGIDRELEFVVASNLKSVELKENPIKKDNVIKDKYPFLNARYTFETFVVGTNNNLAHAASLAVAESPAEVYNPLFIYGGVGLGKTHLMHSIAHFILEEKKETKVLYVTSETFTNELIDSIRNRNDNSMAEFREKYRHIDVLLIDDIQFIIGKESTQEEFFHTFNTLHESKKQIIISSDKPPKDIETLEDRLRSRFEWGLTVDIQSPDYETRMAILKKKEELDGLSIDDDVMKYIATNIKSNIRELEGAVTKIVALSRLKNREVNVSLAEEALKDHISPDKNREVNAEYITEVVSEHFNVAQSDLLSTKKSRNIAYPRQVCMYLCRKYTVLSLSEIGKKLGNRDHTTILHGIDKIESDLKKDSVLENTIEALNKKISPQ